MQTSEIFNYENKNSYTLRRVTDNGTPGLTLETIFTIRVKNVNDTPVAVADEISPTLQVISEATDIFVLTINDTDQDINDVLTVASVTTPTTGSGTVGNLGSAVRYTPTANFNGPVIFPYTVSDGQAASTSANVTLQVVANDARGDCNSDSALNAGDFPAFVLEINDGDDASPWYDIYISGFAGSPLGCDANANKSVTIADLSCAVLVSFGNTTCTTSPALAANDSANAKLAIDQNLVGVLDSTVNVPIRLTTNEQHVAAANFALSFDKEQLTFDPTDADQNGLPGEVVNFNTPAGMVTTAHYNAAANRLELTIYAVTMPMPTLSDGMVAEVTESQPRGLTETPLTLLQSSLGSDQSINVTGDSRQITRIIQSSSRC
ncbi:MAG: Ig-like domain-containing protein [Caldilineaceae bacterium]